MSSVQRIPNESFVTIPTTPNPAKRLQDAVIMALVRKALREATVKNNKNNFYIALPVITLIACSCCYFVFKGVFSNSLKGPSIAYSK